MIYIYINKLVINLKKKHSKLYLDFIKSLEEKEIYVRFNRLLYNYDDQEFPSLTLYGVTYSGYDKCVKYINKLIGN